MRPGFPFRGPIADAADGDARVVQMKDVDAVDGIVWSRCSRTTLGGRKRPEWLRAGDILFLAKGGRFQAVTVPEPPIPAVCAPTFFHLRVRDAKAADPAFIAWQINQRPCQRQLQQAAEGSAQRHIRRPVLEQLRLSVPAIDVQRRITALATLAQRERLAFHRLIRNRETQLQAIAEQLGSYATMQDRP